MLKGLSGMLISAETGMWSAFGEMEWSQLVPLLWKQESVIGLYRGSSVPEIFCYYFSYLCSFKKHIVMG